MITRRKFLSIAGLMGAALAIPWKFNLGGPWGYKVALADGTKGAVSHSADASRPEIPPRLPQATAGRRAGSPTAAKSPRRSPVTKAAARRGSRRQAA